MTGIDDLLARTGALLSGHFKLTSGRHSGQYIEKFRIMEDPAATAALCGLIAQRFRTSNVSVVVGPAIGGVVLSFETARQLGVRGIFAEKDAGGRLVLERGFRLGRGERVLVVDDVLTTGGSVRQVLALLREAGAEVAGIAFLVDRTGGAVDFGPPVFACHTLVIPDFEAAACPFCREGLPLVET